jgi:mannosyltransferase
LRRDWAAIAAITALAAAVRILGLDAKGYWEDEASSVLLLKMDLGGMLSAIPGSERTPPLYYLLAWPWTRLFGLGEVGLRSLSVLIGTGVVPIAYLAGRELVSRRTGIVVAALVAVNPLLVWYSQEGRAYSLLALTSAISLLFFARALREPRPRWLVLWALSSIFAICSHYFAAFLFIGEAAWLIAVSGSSRSALVATGSAGAAGLALLPLAVSQSDARGGIDWIPDISLAQRAVEPGGYFLVGFELPYPAAIAVAAVAALLTLAGLVLLLQRGDQGEKRGALVAGSVGVAGYVIPLVLVIAGVDFFIYKNVLGTLLPFAIVVAAGFAAAAGGRLGLVLASCLVALSLGVVVSTAAEPKYHRESWREAVEALGDPQGERAIVLTPGAPAREPLQVYLPDAGELEQGEAARPVELDVLALPRRELGAIGNPELPTLEGPPASPSPGYTLVESRRTDDFLLLRYRAESPRWLSGEALASSAVDPGVAPLILLEPAPQ